MVGIPPIYGDEWGMVYYCYTNIKWDKERVCFNYPVVNGGSDQRSELGVSIFPIYPLFNGEPFAATVSFPTI